LPPHRCRTFPLLLVQMGYGFLCGLWVWRRRTNRRPCCPPMSYPSTSSWTARPDGAERWDNRMAAQHLPRDLVRPSSGQQQLTQTTKKRCGWFSTEIQSFWPGASPLLRLWPSDKKYEQTRGALTVICTSFAMPPWVKVETYLVVFVRWLGLVLLTDGTEAWEERTAAKS